MLRDHPLTPGKEDRYFNTCKYCISSCRCTHPIRVMLQKALRPKPSTGVSVTETERDKLSRVQCPDITQTDFILGCSQLCQLEC